MEHTASIQCLGGTFITKWTARSIGALSQKDQQAFAGIVQAFGQLSAVSQGLKAPITDFAKLISGDQVLFLAAHRPASHKVVIYGGLKVGPKRLWVWPPGERSQQEAMVTCILDFYVHESVQRMGVGTQLFEAFLADERTTPDALAYDLPSPKCQAFLTKHFGLENPIGLTNNYVVFPSFFQALHMQAQPSGSWASISARPLTSAGRKRPSLPGPNPGSSPVAQRHTLGMGATAASPVGTKGCFSAGQQEQGTGWQDTPSRHAAAAEAEEYSGASGTWRGSPAHAQGSRGVHAKADSRMPQSPARAQQGYPVTEEHGIKAHRRSRASPSAECLPPLHQAHIMRHIAGSSASSTGVGKPRPQILISPAGKAQRSGAAASACLQW